MEKIEILIILNAFISQIAVSFIFTIIESLFLDLGEEFIIKILPSSVFSDTNENYYNKSFVYRLRDYTVYDASQTNIIIWTSIIGAYFLNKYGRIKNLLIFYILTIISLIMIIFLPYKPTNQKESLIDISNSKIEYKKVFFYFINLIILSVSIGNYNLHSLQYIACQYDSHKGFLIPFYVGLGCIVKYIYTRSICNIWEEHVDPIIQTNDFQTNDHYKKFLILIVVFIIICLIISFVLTYKLEIEINLSRMRQIINKDILNLSEKKNFKKDLNKLYCEKGNYELYYFFILNFLSKFEKIEWKKLINFNLYKLDLEFKRYINLSFIFISFIIGHLHDKYDYKGFKYFLIVGNTINLILSFIYMFIYKINNKSLDIFISYFNIFFVGNYYAIMLPELIKKYGKRYILEVSGFIGLSNLISRIIEIFFILYGKEKKGVKFFLVMIIQIICSLISLILLKKEKINRIQFQFDLEDSNDAITNIKELTIPITDLELNNPNENDNDI